MKKTFLILSMITMFTSALVFANPPAKPGESKDVSCNGTSDAKTGGSDEVVLPTEGKGAPAAGANAPGGIPGGNPGKPGT